MDPMSFPLGEPFPEGVNSVNQKPSAAPRTNLQERFGKSLSISTKSPTAANDAAKHVNTPPKRITSVLSFDKLYEIGDEVMPCGHDHMAVHYARHRTSGLERVVKLRIKPKCFRGPTDEMAWRRSTEYLLNLPHNDNIARIYEVLEDSKAFYIVMEKVNGLDLFEALVQERPSVEQAREIIQQLLRAMAHLHAHSAVHKDLKLENVMIDSSELSPKSSGRSQSPMLSPSSVKVIDFDTVDYYEPHSPGVKEIVGTDRYIAQEAYAGQYSPLSDIFAAGVIAYKLLSGKFPFHADLFDDEPGENWVGHPKMAEIRSKLKTTKVDFSHDVFKQHPEASDLVQRMLSHSCNARPSAAGALQHKWFSSILPASKSPKSAALPNLLSQNGDVRTCQNYTHDSVCDPSFRTRSAMPGDLCEDPVPQEACMAPLSPTLPSAKKVFSAIGQISQS